MIDSQALVFERLSVEGATVLPERNAGISYPAVIASTFSAGDSLAARGACWVTLTVSILATADDVFRLAESVYEQVHSWQGVSSAHGHVNRVEDQRVPSSAASTAVDKSVEQWTGIWRLLIRY